MINAKETTMDATKPSKTPAKMSDTHTTVAVRRELLPALDLLVGRALSTGNRPAGRYPSRGSVIAALIEQAAAALRQGHVAPAASTPTPPTLPMGKAPHGPPEAHSDDVYVVLPTGKRS